MLVISFNCYFKSCCSIFVVGTIVLVGLSATSFTGSEGGMAQVTFTVLVDETQRAGEPISDIEISYLITVDTAQEGQLESRKVMVPVGEVCFSLHWFNFSRRVLLKMYYS